MKARTVGALGVLTIALFAVAAVCVARAGAVRAMKTLAHASLNRQLHSDVGALERAHLEHDDLAQARIVSQIGRSPGVISASLVTADGRVIADGDPLRVGTLFKSTSKGDARRYVLGENPPWGVLLIHASEAPFRAEVARQMSVASAGVGVFSAALVAALLCTLRYRVRNEKREALFRSQLAEAQDAARHAAERLDRQLAQARWWAALALEQVGRPSVLLDEHQRVLALSSAAREALELPEAAYEGASWGDLPALAHLGPTIAGSLESPRRTFRASEGGVPMEVCTLDDPALATTATWITLA